MIIWRGYGWLTLVFIGVLIACMATSASVFGSAGKVLLFVFPVIFIVGNAWVGRRLNASLEAQGIPFFKRHSLFWIPMEWWSGAYLVLLIIFAVSELSK